MARIKSGPNGLYSDANDTGPDQGSPEEIAAFKQKTAAPAAGAPTDSPLVKYMMDSPQTGYSEGPGGLSGNGETDNRNKPAGEPGGLTGAASDWTQPAQTTTPAAATATPAAPSYAYMEGVDAGKLNDPNHKSPKYEASRILASGGSIQDAARAIGATVTGPDTMTLSTGETIDTRRDIEGANQLQWLVTGDPNDPNWGKPNGGAGGGTTPGVTGMNPGAGGINNSGIPGGAAGSLFNTLMGRANQSLDVNRKDPIIANNVNAYDAAQERSNRDYLRHVAEQAGPISNLNQERRMTAESRGRNTGGFQAQLMQQELTARRSEIQQALSGATGLLTEEQRQSLSRELAQMDNALSYARLNQDNSQFTQNMNQNAYQFDSNDEFRRSPLAS